MNILKYLGIVLLIYFGALPAHGQTAKIKPVPLELLVAKGNMHFEHFTPFSLNANQAIKTEAENYVVESTVLNLDQAILAQLYQSNADAISIDIPTNNGTIMVIDLIKSDAIPIDLIAGTLSENRVNNELNYEPGHYYKGMIEGDNSSLVSFSVFKDKIHGLILGGFGNMNLGKFNDAYIFYNDNPSNMLVPFDFTCGVSDDDEIIKEEIKSQGKSTAPAKNCVYFYFETAFHLYEPDQTAAHLTDIINDITANFNDVATIYINESVKLVLSEVNAWVTADPYDFASSSTALTTFRDEMAISGYNARFAHLISTNNGNGGRAYVQSSWCGPSQQWRTAYSDLHGTSNTPLPTYSWNVNVIGHEIGHNLGSRHTQWCGWTGGAIDNCVCTETGCALGAEPDPSGGTLMSYCHLLTPDNTDCPTLVVGGVGGTNPGINLSLGLGPLPGNEIRDNYNDLSNRACMHGCNCPTILIKTGILAANSFEEAHSWILSNATLSTGYSINFDAGEKIDLYPGFNTEPGNKFEAYIDGCGHLKNEIESTHEDGQQDQWNSLNPISLYPNPNNGQFNLELNEIESQLPQIRIYDMYGRVIHSFRMKNKTETIKLDQLPSGVYLLRSIWEDHSFINRLIIN